MACRSNLRVDEPEPLDVVKEQPHQRYHDQHQEGDGNEQD